MDTLLILGWVLFCDIIMVYATYRLAYREADKARETVEQRYSEALAEVSKLSKAISDIKFPEIPPYPVIKIPTVDEIIAKIPPYPKVPTVDEIIKAIPPYPPIHIPDDEMARIRESVSGAINGTVGSYAKKIGSEMQAEEEMDVGQVLMKSLIQKLTK